MLFLAKRSFAIPMASMVAFLTMGAPDASAQTLFERLFGGNLRERRMMEREPVAPPPAPKVSAPSYYSYKVDPLVRIDFAALGVVPAEQTSVNSVTLTSAMTSPNVVRLGEAEDVSGDDRFRRGMAALAGEDLMAERDIADAVQARYKANPSFVWLVDDKPSYRAREAMAVLGEAATHGLPADAYAVAPLRSYGLDEQQKLAELARFDAELSVKTLRYVRDALRGRVDPNRLSGYHDFKAKPLDLPYVLDVLADTFSTRQYLESWHPANPHYAALRTELEELRASEEKAIVVDPGTFIRPGGTSTEFPKLLTLIERQADAAFLSEFGDVLKAAAGTETYSDDLVPLVRAAQQARGLKPDGIIGPRSVAAIAGASKGSKIQSVLVAMEQLRWLPSDLGSRHVMINVPAFEASYVEDGESRLSMRTVVGKNATQTFFFQDQISYVEFHPYWGIPRSILVNTYLPKLYSNPGYLDQIGYEVTDSRGRRVSSASINWPAYGSKIPFDVRQPPGPRNSLGEMKIMFPNRHAIYMHDTPDKHLFDRDSRNFSNGCVRLQDPRGMAAAVLGWTRGEVEDRLKGGHGQVDLDVKVPVYVAYFTAWTGNNGEIVYNPDVYGRDEYVLKAMTQVEEARAPSA